MGYSTDPVTGRSAAIGYVDAGSTDYPPVEGRSYYGRGVIQLSWNYNYGAFSSWMFDNGLFKTASDAAGKCRIDYRKSCSTSRTWWRTAATCRSCRASGSG